jgi:membrane peptidoglycan carboxypeptidase
MPTAADWHFTRYGVVALSMGTTTPLGTAGRRQGSDRGPRRRRRLVRLAIRAGQVLVLLVVVGAAAFGVLLLVTPSVGNARQLAQAIDRARHAAYPGPPVPPRFAAALEATEDHRFNDEPGIDPIAAGRFLLGEITGHGDEGGATLYAQLAKMLYTPGDASITAQAEQAALAVKLRYAYGPAEVLRLYSAIVYFGHGYYGLAAASCGYFGVPPDQMSWPQAALLAGLVKGPTVDDPLTFPANAVAREQHVIGRLVATRALTPAQASGYLKIPLSTLVAGAGGCRS